MEIKKKKNQRKVEETRWNSLYNSEIPNKRRKAKVFVERGERSFDGGIVRQLSKGYSQAFNFQRFRAGPQFSPRPEAIKRPLRDEICLEASDGFKRCTRHADFLLLTLYLIVRRSFVKGEKEFFVFSTLV